MLSKRDKLEVAFQFNSRPGVGGGSYKSVLVKLLKFGYETRLHCHFHFAWLSIIHVHILRVEDRYLYVSNPES